MTNSLIIPENATPELIDKMQRWALMGKKVSEIKSDLQVRSQSLILGMPIPTDIKLIADYDITLAAARKSAITNQEFRKTTTSKFDAVITDLMKPEKETDKHLIAYGMALLALKKTKQEEDNAITNKNNELKRLRETISNLIATHDANYRTKITSAVHLALEAALKGGCPDEASVPAYLQSVKEGSIRNGDTPESFIWMRPELPLNFGVTLEDINALWAEMQYNIPLPVTYRALFYTELDLKFEFYNTALNYKAEVIAQSKKEVEQTAVDNTTKLEQNKLAHALNTLATPLTVSTISSGKSIKKYWFIEMPDDEATATRIMAAFIANIALCREHVRAAWSKLSVSQMSSALATIKNKDSAFSVTGINFIQKEKL